MLRELRAICICLIFCAAFAVAAPPKEGLSAAQIVDKNVEARGGLQAWRAVQTLSLQEKWEQEEISGRCCLCPHRTQKNSPILPRRRAEETQLPFLMEMKRPRKVRVELQFHGQTAVPVCEGTNGWKLRPFLNRTEIEPFTEEELRRN